MKKPKQRAKKVVKFLPKKQIEKESIKSAERLIWKVLNCLQINQRRVSIAIQLTPIPEEPDENERWSNAYGECEYVKKVKKRYHYRVALNPSIFSDDALLKGTITHEALHLAYDYYHRILKDSNKFYEVSFQAIKRAFDTLALHYDGWEETIVAVLEPLMTFNLLPSLLRIRKDWTVTLN